MAATTAENEVLLYQLAADTSYPRKRFGVCVFGSVPKTFKCESIYSSSSVNGPIIENFWQALLESRKGEQKFQKIAFLNLKRRAQVARE